MKVVLLVDLHDEASHETLRSYVEDAINHSDNAYKLPSAEVSVMDLYFTDEQGGEQMSPTDALYGFLGWVTSRKETVKLSAKSDAAPVVKALKEFIEVNKLPKDTSINFPKNITTPDFENILNAERSKIGARLFIQQGVIGGTVTPVLPEGEESETEDEGEAKVEE